MKSIYKNIIFIISAIALFSIIVGVLKYSLTYIENNPEKYLPKQKQEKNWVQIHFKKNINHLKSVSLRQIKSWKSKIIPLLIKIVFLINLKVSINIKYLRTTRWKERKSVKKIFQNFVNRGLWILIFLFY